MEAIFRVLNVNNVGSFRYFKTTITTRTYCYIIRIKRLIIEVTDSIGSTHLILRLNILNTYMLYFYLTCYAHEKVFTYQTIAPQTTQNWHRHVTIAEILLALQFFVSSKLCHNAGLDFIQIAAVCTDTTFDKIVYHFRYYPCYFQCKPEFFMLNKHILN